MARYLLALALLAAAGCAVGPNAVHHMDATRIQAISDYRLCDAAAVALDLERRHYAVIDAEIARRGVSCDEHIGLVVSDCSGLQVLNWGNDSTNYGIIFTVRNDRGLAMSFRIRREDRQSHIFSIGPGETQRFGITDPGVAQLGETLETIEGDGGIEFLDCHPAIIPAHINYHPTRQSAPRAAVIEPSAPPPATVNDGVRSRATRNVSLRAGPGTNHAIIRTLSSGEEVTILGVVGTWCEARTSRGERGYVSCTFLSPRPGGQTESTQSPSSQIRLTAIRRRAGGSNCSLYLDSGLQTLVGETEYGSPHWTVGLNGRSYRLQEGRYSQSTLHLSGANGSISLDIDQGAVLRASTDPAARSRITSVTVRVTMNRRSSSLPAYQACGEG